MAYEGVSTEEAAIVQRVKVIVAKHPDRYVSYPLGLQGVIVGEGDTYEEALTAVLEGESYITSFHSAQSAMRRHNAHC